MDGWIDALFDNKIGSKFSKTGYGKHQCIDGWMDGLMD
jgi:hypothetical protein